jgi:hypothetical protein
MLISTVLGWRKNVGGPWKDCEWASEWGLVSENEVPNVGDVILFVASDICEQHRPYSGWIF